MLVILCTLLTLKLQSYGGLRIKTFAGVGQNDFPPCKVHFDCILSVHNHFFSLEQPFFTGSQILLELAYFLELMVFALGSGNSAKRPFFASL